MMRSSFANILTLPKRIGRFILDAFFPIRCLGCGEFDQWICDTCHASLPLLTEQKCPLCKKHTTPQGDVCFSCCENSPMINGVYIASSLDSDLVKKAVHYYKYRFVRDLSEPLALLLAQALHNSHMQTPDMIIPVPLHPRRLRWRGFNQAAELAYALDLRIPVKTDILKRVRYTTPQVAMKNKARRQKNLSNAFAVSDASAVYGKKILLIDDIMTTGTTLMECATALRSAGAYSVHCLVIARE